MAQVANHEDSAYRVHYTPFCMSAQLMHAMTWWFILYNSNTHNAGIDFLCARPWPIACHHMTLAVNLGHYHTEFTKQFSA